MAADRAAGAAALDTLGVRRCLPGERGTATLWFALKRRIALLAALAPATGLALAYLLVATMVYPLFEPRKSARPFALRIKEVTAESRAAGVPVVAYDLGNLPEPFAYYSERHVHGGDG